MTLVRSVGHGTLGADELASLLAQAGVEHVVDVRRYPGSRRHPHFGRDSMAEWLPERGVGYSWEERLGGRRVASPASPNVALRQEAFQAYADHMLTDEFREALDDVLARATARATAVLCSETLWWRCHRRLLADALVLARGAEVDHLFPDGSARRHEPMPEARLVDGRLVYDVGETPPML